MMKKLLFVCMIVLASTDVLAQDFEANSELIKKIMDKTAAVKQKPKAQEIAKNADFNLDSIDYVLLETNELNELVDSASKSNALTPTQSTKYFTDIHSYLLSYLDAILGGNITSVYIKNESQFVNEIRKLHEFAYESFLQLKKQKEPNDKNSGGTRNEENSTDNGKKVFDSSKEWTLNDYVLYGFMIISLFLLIIVILLVWTIRFLRLTIKKEDTPLITEEALRGIVQRLGKDIEICFNKNFDSISSEIKILDNSIINTSKLLSDLKSSFEEKINRQQCVNQGENHKNSLTPKDTSKPPRSQIVKLYGSLNQDGTMIWKAEPDPKPDYFYQINLKNENDSKGELLIREGLSTDRMKEAIKDRSKYLKSSACDITSDTESATHVETVKGGTVERQGYNWKITERVQVKIV